MATGSEPGQIERFADLGANDGITGGGIRGWRRRWGCAGQHDANLGQSWPGGRIGATGCRRIRCGSEAFGATERGEPAVGRFVDQRRKSCERGLGFAEYAFWRWKRIQWRRS